MAQFLQFLCLLLLCWTLIAPLRAAADSENILAQFERRDRILVVQSAPQGLHYTVKTVDGVLLDADLSEADLAERYPDLHKILTEGMAVPGLSSPSAGEMQWGGLFPESSPSPGAAILH